LGSVPGFNTSFRPTLRALYRDIAICEIFDDGATECMFGHHRYEKKAWVSNYDLFLRHISTEAFFD
jgi:hypothetical protein